MIMNHGRYLLAIRKMPSITKEELSKLLRVSLSTIDNYISFLKANNYIERVGPNKTGYWNVIE